MAYAAVASLLQTLEYLLKILRLIYEIKKIQGRKLLLVLQEFPTLSSSLILVFDKIRRREVSESQDLQEYSILSSRLHRLIAQAETLASSVEHFIEAVGLFDPEMKFTWASSVEHFIAAVGLPDSKMNFAWPSPEEYLLKAVGLPDSDMKFTGASSGDHSERKPAWVFWTEQITGAVSDTKFITWASRLQRYIKAQIELGFNIDAGSEAATFEEETILILQQLEQFDRDSKTFVDFYVQNITFQVLNDQNNPPEEALKLAVASRRIKEDISHFSKESRLTASVYQKLRCFLTALDDSRKKWHCALIKFIEHVADRERDLIEESIVQYQIESAITRFVEIVFRINPTARAQEKDPFEKVISNAFHGEKGIHESLFVVFSDIHFVMRQLEHRHPDEVQIQTIRWKNGYEIFSSRSSSIVQRDSNEEEMVVGFDDELMRILEGLTGLPSGLEVVTIVGMGGIGKTTLAKKLSNHPYIAHHFYCRAWITISAVYQVRDLLLGLLSSIGQRSDKIKEKSNTQLAEDLYRCLKGKRYLIIIDDLWSIDAWNDVKRCFPDDKLGSRIIVTSRFTELANQVSPNKRPHFINLLDKEKSWELLQKLVFGIASCSLELVEVGKEIANRCRGLPLVIVVIAGILSRTARTLDSWKHIAKNLSSVVFTDPEQCLDILALSYKYLPHHLRACFLYMGAFPEDCEIEAQKLINLWVAEGFIFSNCPENLEQIAEDYLEDLIGRNIVCVEKRRIGGKVKTCRLHDFLRELCIREAQKEKFMNVVQRGSSKNLPVSVRDLRRLSFDLEFCCPLPPILPLPRVSSFLCFTLGSTTIPDISFFPLEFELLRVLDIYFLHFEHFPKQVQTLIHLRYLALNVTFELPATLSQLRNLQTFVIQGPWCSWIHSSSPEILLEYWSMSSLRHLHFSVASKLRNPPIVQEDFPGPFVPEYLQTLSTIRFSSCTKEVFTVMPLLKSLGICETKEDYSANRSCCLLNNIVCLRELETLKCSFYPQIRKVRRLLSLYSFPKTLRHLSLSWSYLPWEDMTAIAMLPKLQVLKLKHYAFQGPNWLPIKHGFRCLKHLLIENSDLVQWEATVYQFPCLSTLILKSCKHLEQIPFGVDAIGSVLRIEVHYCSEPIELLAKKIQEQVEGVDVVIGSDQ